MIRACLAIAGVMAAAALIVVLVGIVHPYAL